MEEDKENEDIKYLEDLISFAKMLLTTSQRATIQEKEIEVLENLIVRYKEVEQNYINPSKARFSYYDKGKGVEVVIEGFIPKSKVKEKIEELDKNIVDAKAGDYDFIGECRIKKYVLQELLED